MSGMRSKPCPLGRCIPEHTTSRMLKITFLTAFKNKVLDESTKKTEGLFYLVNAGISNKANDVQVTWRK